MYGRSHLVALLAALTVASIGCNQSNSTALSIAAQESGEANARQAPVQQWIVGQWSGVVALDREAVAKVPEMTPQDIATIESMKMIVSFDTQGEMKMSAIMKTPDGGERQSSSTANWEVVEADGDRLKIKSQESGHDPEEVEIQRLDAQRFSMPAPQNVGAMVFTRTR